MLPLIAAHYPKNLPLICLGGSGRFVIVPLSFRPVPWSEVSARPLVPKARSAKAPGVPFERGIVGLLSYDMLAAPEQAGPSQLFDVSRALVIDQKAQSVVVTGDDKAGDPPRWTVPAAAQEALVAAVTQSWAQPSRPRRAALVFTLKPADTDQAYEQLVECALAEIRAGRYYQINLLRYFTAVPNAAGVSRESLAERLEAFGGPFAAFFDLPELTVASFSPERFVRLLPEAGALTAETYPIKGTAARGATPAADLANAEALAASAKDRAELNMIVDLMRNDLNRISRPGTVAVVQPGQVVSNEAVHHLEAQIRSTLRPGLTLGEVLTALSPGGSITGAPKREVMTAISAYEKRQRGYFMGHAFYLDDSGAFDSSILIRTLVRTGEMPYAFAAGSGIVVGSDPASERREIAAKCRVISAAQAQS